MPKIVVEKGPDKGKIITVSDKGAITLGREVPSTCRLSDPLASRAHFKIENRSGEFFLVDLDSLNGTFLNGKKVKEAKLKKGDKIQVGENIMTFVGDEEDFKIDPLVNQTIAGYRIFERIGRGGMGTVYKATQLSLNRTVAFKIMSDELTKDKDFINLFIQEARAAAQLNHPNIIQVYDVGKSGDIFFFSMEYLPNGSIHDWLLKNKKMPVQQAVRVIIQAARGLEYAEKKKIVHRDIKPDNLMLAEDFTVKIGDLGLAKQLQDKQAKEEKGIFGTPHYIAPEQALGKYTDHRADIYALGSTFYRLLAGFPPYSGNSVKEIILKKLESEPKPLREIDPNIPPSLVAIIEKMMKKKVEERYQSATEVLKDLSEIEKISSQTQPSTVIIPEKKNSAVTIILISIILLLAVGGSLYFFVFNKKEQPQPNTIPPITNNQPPSVNPLNIPREILEEVIKTNNFASEFDREIHSTGHLDPAKIQESILKYQRVLDLLKDYPDDDYYVNAQKRINELEIEKREVEAEIALKILTKKLDDAVDEILKEPLASKQVDFAEKINPLKAEVEEFINNPQNPQNLIEKAKMLSAKIEESKKLYKYLEERYTKALDDSSNFFSNNKFYESVKQWDDFLAECIAKSLHAERAEKSIINFFDIKARNEKRELEKNINAFFKKEIDEISIMVNKAQFKEAFEKLDALDKLAQNLLEPKIMIFNKRKETITAKVLYDQQMEKQALAEDKFIIETTYLKSLPDIFNYKYENALKKFSLIESKIKTDKGELRYKRILSSISAEKSLFETFCSLVNSGKLKNPYVDIPKRRIKKGKVSKIDSDKMHIELSGVSATTALHLREIPYEVIYQLIAYGWNLEVKEKGYLIAFCIRRGLSKEATKLFEEIEEDLSNNPPLKSLFEYLKEFIDEGIEKFINGEAALIGNYVFADTDDKIFTIQEKIDLLELICNDFNNTRYYRANKTRIKHEIESLKEKLNNK